MSRPVLRSYGRNRLVVRAEEPAMETDGSATSPFELYRADVDRLSDVFGRRPPWPAFQGGAGPEVVAEGSFHGELRSIYRGFPGSHERLPPLVQATIERETSSLSHGARRMGL